MEDSLIATGTGTRIEGRSFSGTGALIEIAASEVTLVDAQINSDASNGISGDIMLRVGRLNIHGEGHVRSSASGGGPAGATTLIATKGVLIAADGQGDGGIFSEGRQGASAGKITITAPLLEVAGGSISTAAFGASAGDIVLKVDELRTGSQGRVRSSATDGGVGGTTSVIAAKGIVIDGSGSSRGGIFSEGQEGGAGGEISIRTPSLQLAGGRISASSVGSSEDAIGGAGTIRVEADFLEISGGGELSTRTDNEGAGGTIRVDSADVDLSTGGSISASTSGPGSGGIIDLRASRSVSISGQGTGIRSVSEAGGNTRKRAGSSGKITIATPHLEIADRGEVSARAADQARGGDVELQLDDLRLSEASTIEAFNSGSGIAGSIFVDAEDTIQLNGSSISTSALGGRGGNITINAGQLIELVDSEIDANVGSGVGGNIIIDPVFVILENSRIVAQAGEGRGGRISITADHFIADPDSVVSASAGDPQRSGTVEINSPEVDLAGTLSTLPDSFLDAAGLMRERCASRRPEEAIGRLRRGGARRPAAWARQPTSSSRNGYGRSGLANRRSAPNVSPRSHAPCPGRKLPAFLGDRQTNFEEASAKAPRSSVALGQLGILGEEVVEGLEVLGERRVERSEAVVAGLQDDELGPLLQSRPRSRTGRHPLPSWPW